jgi:RNA polymerase sigma-70 factor (ECF subfamily)
VQNALNGDSKAQSHLYQQYSKAMFHICIRMTGNREQAEDLLQDAFIIAFKNLHQLKESQQFGGWLRRIVVNECISFSKKKVRWKEWEDHFEDIADDNSVAWWKTVSLEMVHQQIKALPDGCREIFNLYALEDLSHREIAHQLGCSESTSKSQYHRAKQLLREKINTQIALHG